MDGQDMDTRQLENRLTKVEANYQMVLEILADLRTKTESFTDTAQSVIKITAGIENLTTRLTENAERVQRNIETHTNSSERTWDKVENRLDIHNDKFNLQDGRIQGIRLVFWVVSALFSIVTSLALYIYNDKISALQRSIASVAVHEKELAELRGRMEANQQMVTSLASQVMLRQSELKREENFNGR